MAMVKSDKVTKGIPLKRTERNYSDMADSRIITKNLVYVIGLSAGIATKETLLKKEYFGQYGTITKIVVNNNKAYNQNNPNGPSYSAYVTYSKPYEASIAILSLDNIVVDDHLIRASFGTTKYCSFYLKKIECTNKDCLFLHRIADPNDIISREDLNGNKNIFMEQQLYAMKIADIYNPEIKKKLLAGGNNSNINLSNFANNNPAKKLKNVFPIPEHIFNKDIVKENDPILLKNKMTTKKKYYEDVNTPHNVENQNPPYKNSLRNLFQNDKSSANNNAASKENININTTKLNNLSNVININRQKSSFSILADSTSTSSKEDINYTNSASEDKNTSSNTLKSLVNTPKANENESAICTQKLFYIRDTSRFNFNAKDHPTPMTTIEVPNFIQHLILKKSASFLLTRPFKHLGDLFYSDKTLESEYRNKNPWAQFIVENKTESINKEDDDKDLIEDFDYINNLVLNKCRTYK